MERKDYKNVLWLIIFGLVLILGIFIFGNIFGANMDWINQHTVIPEYFRQYFYETKKLLPDIIYNLGLGENAFNFSYYGLLSPIILLSYVLPFVNMTTYIIISSIVLYLVSIYLFYKFLRPKFDIKTTTLLTFVFMCVSPILFQFHRQIMFVNYIPFLLMALINIDNYAKRSSKIFLILNVFCLFLTSYYFSIGSILVILIYYIFLNYEKTFKEKIKIIIPILIGVLLSGILLIPSLLSILSNRTSLNESVNWLSLLLPNFNYSKVLYGSYALGLFSISIISMVYLLLKKEKKFKFLGIVLLIIISFPIFRYLLNGGLYIRSKALIPFIPLIILVLGIFLKDLLKQEIDSKKLFIILVTLILLSVLDFSLVYFLDLMGTAFVLYLYYKLKNKYILIIPLVMLSGITIITSNLNEQYVTVDEYKNLDINSTLISTVIEQDDTFYRIAELDNTLYNVNRNFSKKHYKSSVYASVVNNDYKNFYYNVLNINNNNYNNLILRDTNNIIFNKLTGVKYLISSNELGYGYSEIADNIYMNEYALSLGYASSNIYSLSEFKELEYPYNLKYLLNGIVVDGKSDDSVDNIIEEYNFDLLEKLEDSGYLSYQNGSYYLILNQEKSFEIELDNTLSNQLLFITINGLESNSCNHDDISITINNQENVLSCSTWVYHNQNYTFNYLINEKNLNKLTINIKPGKYKIDSINLYTMDIKHLNYQFDQMTNINIEDNQITGQINVTNDGYMTLSLPHDQSFAVFIDNKEVKIEKTNTAFVGFKITKGLHNIKIVYKSQSVDFGKIVSGFGLLLFVIYIIVILKNKNNFARMR